MGLEVIRSNPGGAVEAFRPRMYFAVDAFFTQAWANMPAAETELAGATRTRQRADLADARQARLGVRVIVAGSAGAELRVKASPNDTLANFVELADVAGAGNVLINVVGTRLSGWFDVAAANRTADRFVALFGIGGDGVADPSFGVIFVEFRT